ncbi:MAG: hypothetical protein ABR573_09175, partial [Candidatus Dormibacteria bacterium]
TGTTNLNGDLVGPKFAGVCVAGSPGNPIVGSTVTCQTTITGAPRVVVITPGFDTGNAGRMYVDTLGLNATGGTFAAHFPGYTPTGGEKIYYVVIR